MSEGGDILAASNIARLAVNVPHCNGSIVTPIAEPYDRPVPAASRSAPVPTRRTVGRYERAMTQLTHGSPPHQRRTIHQQDELLASRRRSHSLTAANSMTASQSA